MLGPPWALADKRPGFLSEECFIDLIKSEQLCMNELDIFRAVKRWGESMCSTSKLDVAAHGEGVNVKSDEAAVEVADQSRRQTIVGAPDSGLPPADLKACVSSAMAHVRLGLIGGPDLATEVRPSGLIGDAELCEAFAAQFTGIHVDQRWKPRLAVQTQERSSSSGLWLAGGKHDTADPFRRRETPPGLWPPKEAWLPRDATRRGWVTCSANELWVENGRIGATSTSNERPLLRWPYWRGHR
jgi:hypothetical protein